MKASTIRQWTEVDQTMLTDKKRGVTEHILFVARCEERQSEKTGKITRLRHKDVKSFEGDTESEADSKVARFCEGEGVIVLEHDTPWTK